MSDDMWAVQVTFTLPPGPVQYEKGAMLNVRATGSRQLAMELEALREIGKGEPVVQRFLDHFDSIEAPASASGLRKAAARKPAKQAGKVLPEAKKPTHTAQSETMVSPEMAAAIGAGMGAAAVAKQLGATVEGEEPSRIQQAVAKQLGISIDGMSKADAQSAIEEARRR